jgi:hypothetical protein
LPFWYTEKRHHEDQYDQCNDEDHPAQPGKIKTENIKRKNVDDAKQYGCPGDRFIAFLVNSHNTD